MDVAGSLFALILLSPLMLLMALYIKIVSPGPAIFHQQRVGFRGRLFTFFKFRTMKLDNDSSHHRQHLRNLIQGDDPMIKLDTSSATSDPRIIPGGRILRTLALDELPQFWNILRGDMSLVGPRPCIPYEAAEFLMWHKQRFDIVPGLTGLWQVSGKNSLSFKEMIRLDNTYARTVSPLLDLKIVLLTIPALAGIAFGAVGRVWRRHRGAGEKADRSASGEANA
jgi:lipopolysaccharide/colanic/teichoic acid biosynthesis glycosyltransferase